ncbi:hypothetical protein [Archaeoglobus neptunius]|uniref:hypothetical protein n=1 Tax=Archaeoglobus neptunius TaxID=2798580 RepID=UPI0019269178|nr:hypothetical protein [Archaeoglobus neptunius]
MIKKAMIVLLAVSIAVVSATFENRSDLIEIGEIKDDKIRETVEKALEDGELTVDELKTT